jgi:pyridoxamine 5'-phosphate oxidase
MILLDADPFRAFHEWYGEVERSGLERADAMTLATATASGRPSARIVLYKGVARGGFLFFTNYESRKAGELDANPHAALVFHWIPFQRQVRIEGRVERTTREESEAYFATRPRDSQVGTWASPQSAPIESRELLERRAAEIVDRHAGGPIPCPPFWGGYRLVPDAFEFWIGRDHRLHDRFRYERSGGGWSVTRLAP